MKPRLCIWSLFLFGTFSCPQLGAQPRIRLPFDAQGVLTAQGVSPTLKPATITGVTDNATESRLENVRAFLAGKQWEDAVENLLAIMENDGDRLIVAPEPHLPAGFQRFVPVRELCQSRLAEMHERAPEALELYRRRVDSLARRWLEEGVKRRDAELLRRVVEQAFASRSGDDALQRLGELSLERGEHAQARAWWERINPSLRTPDLVTPDVALAAGRSLWPRLRATPLDRVWEPLAPWLRKANAIPGLSYPDSELNPADIRARLVLVSILEGSLDRARWELELLQRLHPAARGRIAGEEGPYVAKLTTLLDEAASWPALPERRDWPTFGGSHTRNTTATACEFDIGGKPLWQRSLPLLSATNNERTSQERVRVAEDASGLLSYHPVIANGLVLFSEPNYLKAFRLHEDAAAWPVVDVAESQPSYGRVYTAFAAGDSFQPHLTDRPFVGVARYTVTVAGQRLFARMRSPITGGDREIPQGLRGAIVGLDLKTQGKMLPGFPLTPDGAEWAFEGTPVADDARLYVALRNHDGVHAGSYVACHDLRDGRRLWLRQVASAEVPGQGQWRELTHNLLTLGAGTIYCNTNVGVVAALSARDGTPRWVMQYPRADFHPPEADRPDRNFFRDLNPCVLHKDFVFVVPTDCDRVFALEAASGQLVWSTPKQTAGDAVHLLGAGPEHLLLSGDYLYWLDLYSGRVVAQFPELTKAAVGHALPIPRGFGRGLVSAERIAFPTRERLYIFHRQLTDRDGRLQPSLARQPIELSRDYGITGGNLVLSQGVLLIATADRLVAIGTK